MEGLQHPHTGSRNFVTISVALQSSFRRPAARYEKKTETNKASRMTTRDRRTCSTISYLQS
ncbi:hypothetical protein C0Q70_15730 [Pomacea canaliculata]|uniref:Uncharacterized protein n=1 Tax=Pomacea canaliculata TaxID=400727 RepID=A0A2T7NVP1_POMCA|nr:hypothetical protein C0Q70_15730 [Pomacea canaliculata]